MDVLVSESVVTFMFNNYVEWTPLNAQFLVWKRKINIICEPEKQFNISNLFSNQSNNYVSEQSGFTNFQ